MGGYSSAGISGVLTEFERDEVYEQIRALVEAGGKASDHPLWQEHFTFTVEEWKIANWLRHTAYHWYDTRFPPRWWYKFEDRLPGNAAVALGFSPGPASRWDRLKGWTVSQDFRCFELGERHEVVGRFQVDRDTYVRVHPEPSTQRPVRWYRRGTQLKEALWAAMQASRRTLRRSK